MESKRKRFHNRHGKNIVMDETCTLATRESSFADAIVFSSNPLSPNEPFVVQILQTERGWSGHLRVGLTQINPSTIVSLPQFAMPDFVQRGHTWICAVSKSHSSMVHYPLDPIRLRRQGEDIEALLPRLLNLRDHVQMVSVNVVHEERLQKHCRAGSSLQSAFEKVQLMVSHIVARGEQLAHITAEDVNNALISKSCGISSTQHYALYRSRTRIQIAESHQGSRSWAFSDHTNSANEVLVRYLNAEVSADIQPTLPPVSGSPEATIPTEVGSYLGVRFVPRNSQYAEMRISVNGRDWGHCADDIPYQKGPVYAVIDVYGTTKAIRVVQSSYFPALQDLCRQVILRSIRSTAVSALPLPNPLKEYLLSSGSH